MIHVLIGSATNVEDVEELATLGRLWTPFGMASFKGLMGRYTWLMADGLATILFLAGMEMETVNAVTIDKWLVLRCHDTLPVRRGSTYDDVL